jgi:hypothetical protein
VEPKRYKVAGIVSLVVGGAAVLLQYVITPLSNGNMTGAEIVHAVTVHHTAMGVALALDTPVLLSLPAVLFIGWLARARSSVLASVATALLFLSFLVVVPQLFGLDGLIYLAGSEPNKAAMAHLVDSWQNSAWFAAGLFPYLLLEIVGSILLAVALHRARTVPLWVVISTAVWPLLMTVGEGGSLRAVAIAGCALQFVTWVAYAICLSRSRQPAPVADRDLVAA